jgi:uncharacterized protein GlcG (DUF336 family)
MIATVVIRRDAMTLTIAQARSILDKTLAAAREKKFKPLGVAVVDSRGALRAYAEEDGNPILRSKFLHLAAGAAALPAVSRVATAHCLPKSSDAPRYFGIVLGK